MRALLVVGNDANDQNLLQKGALYNAFISGIWDEARKYGQAGQPEKAIGQYRKILDIDPKSDVAHAGLGWVYDLQGNHTQAIAEWREARRLSENDPWTIMGLGRAYAAAGKSREAREMLNELIQLSKRQYVTPYVVAKMYAGLGERELCKSTATAILSLN